LAQPYQSQAPSLGRHNITYLTGLDDNPIQISKDETSIRASLAISNSMNSKELLMPKYGWLVWGLIFFTALPPANAAAPKNSPEEAPMQVRILRSTQPGCEPDCWELLSAQGRINAGQTLRQFQRVLRQLKGRKLPVFIHSGGGDVREAIPIGRLIRAAGLDGRD
jgi:hypothetical protein